MAGGEVDAVNLFRGIGRVPSRAGPNLLNVLYKKKGSEVGAVALCGAAGALSAMPAPPPLRRRGVRHSGCPPRHGRWAAGRCEAWQCQPGWRA